MSPEVFCNLAATTLFVGLTLASGWSARRNYKERERINLLRGHAHEVVDRLKREGRGLQGATLEELETIHRALES